MPYFIALVTALFLTGPVPAQQEAKSGSSGLRPALLVIDIQNAYLPMVEEREREVALYVINAVIDLFRKMNYPVIRIYHSDISEGPEPGSQDFEFTESVKIRPDDPMVIKHYASGFKKTDLEKILKEKNVNTVFVCGLSAVGCALATYIEAGDLDYNAFIVKNALMSHNSGYTQNIEEMFNALGYTAIKVMLENAIH